MQSNATRIGWIDTAKGVSALLVVLWHAFLVARLAGHFPDALAYLNRWLMHVRMPMFFLASGIVSARLVQAPLGSLLRRRIVPLLWILAVWTVIDGWVNDWIPLYPWAEGHLPGLGTLLWRPQGELWFLYDLLVLTLLAKVAMSARGWQRAALVLASFALVYAYDHWRAEYFTYELVSNFPFFMIGVFGADHLRDARTTPARILLVALIGLVGSIAAHFLFGPGQVRGMTESLFCVGLGVAAAIGLQSLPRTAGLFDMVGRRSLAIFLGHMPIMAAVYAATPASASTLHPLVVWLGLFAMAAAGSLLLETIAGRIGLSWLYRAPVASLIGPSSLALGKTSE
jgi:uncharacterized membrane protein YcfT